MVIAPSAVVAALIPGELQTAIPLSFAASRSMLLMPVYAKHWSLNTDTYEACVKHALLLFDEQTAL